MQQLAADLDRALGGGHVTISRGSRNTSAADDEIAIAPHANTRGAVDVQSLVTAMNRERTARGLKALKLNASLDAAAEDRVGDMLKQHYFDHVSPQGMEPFVWVDRHGYNYTAVGENLATGYRSADAVVDGWMHSAGHRANLLGKDFADVGVAVTTSSPMRPYGGPLVVAIYATR